MKALLFVSAFAALVALKGLVGTSVVGMAVFFAAFFGALHHFVGFRTGWHAAGAAAIAVVLYAVYPYIVSVGTDAEWTGLLIASFILAATTFIATVMRLRRAPGQP